jgi:hypothetical protein
MNRKTSIVAGILAAVLIFLFSQAYMNKIDKINSKNDSSVPIVNRDDINISISLDSDDINNNKPSKDNEEKNEIIPDELLNQENSEQNIDIQESTEPVTDENGEVIQTTTKRSLLDKKPKKTKKPFSIIDNREETVTETVN